MPESSPSNQYCYELRYPLFSCNSSGTSITVRIGIDAGYYQDTAEGRVVTYVRPPIAGSPSMRFFEGDGWNAGTGFLPLERDRGDIDLSPEVLAGAGEQTGFSGSLTVGYAVTPLEGSTKTQPQQADFVSIGAVPLASHVGNSSIDLSVPAIAQTELTAQFQMPSVPSTFWLAYRSSGAFAGASASLGYGLTFYIPGTPPLTSPTTWYLDTRGSVDTWYAPAVSISLNPPGVRTGESATVTVQAPESLGTLTASSFVVVGGTLTNFSQGS